MSHETQVIKYLRKRTGPNDSDFSSPINLGSKPCFISPTRNSGLNNLEEQLLLGTDNYLKTWEDDEGNTIIEQSFCTANLDVEKTKNYYKMKSIIYKEPIMYSDIAFEKNDFKIANTLDVVFGDRSDPEHDDPYTVYFPIKRFHWRKDGTVDPPIYYGELIAEDSLGGYVKSRVDDLYLIKDNEEDKTLILTKVTGTKQRGDTKVSYSKIYNNFTE